VASSAIGKRNAPRAFYASSSSAIGKRNAPRAFYASFAGGKGTRLCLSRALRTAFKGGKPQRSSIWGKGVGSAYHQ